MTGDPPKGERVASGGFRIDRDRAIQKLKAHRFSDPLVFVDHWARCAAACGATRLEISATRTELHFEFDGRPLAPAVLEDPALGALLSTSLKDAPGKELALGWLALQAFGPSQLELVSGNARRRQRSVTRGLTRARVAPYAVGERTWIEARWDLALTTQPWTARLRDLTPRFAMLPCRLRTPFAELAPSATGELALRFERGAIRGWLAPRAASRMLASEARVYRLGVAVESVPLQAPAPLLAWVSDDRAELDAGGTKLAQGDRFRRLLSLVERRVPELVLHVLAKHRTLFAAAARWLEDADGLKLWEGRSAWEPAEDDLDRSWALVRGLAARKLGDDSERARDLLVGGWLADWLYSMASPLGQPEYAGLDSVQWALWKAPLAFDGKGGTLDRLTLERHRRRRGVVLYSRRKDSARTEPVAWCPTAREIGWLKSAFDEALREEG